MNDFALTIQTVTEDDETYIEVQAVNPDRFQNFGFGTFLCDIVPPEIEITQEALDILLECPERSGMQGMEFWGDNRLAWGSIYPTLLIPLNRISVPREAKPWIKKMTLAKEK